MGNFLLSSIDPALPEILALGLVILILGAVLRRLHQPYVIAYMVAGVLMGEHGFGLITDKETMARMGEFGLILLLFFIGIEINLESLIRQWKVASLGTAIQVSCSVLFVALLGNYLGWPLHIVITLGFVISLSSSAVIIKLLQDKGEIKTEVGQNVISILLIQDILLVPMLIVTNYLGGKAPTNQEVVLQLVGAVLFIGGLIYVIKKKVIRFPFGERLENDSELQVFLSIFMCFGMAWLSAIFGFSAALGAFVAGIFLGAAPKNQCGWIQESLHSFRIVFVALFFVSVGTLIDLPFVLENWTTVGLLILVTFLSNHLINALILKYFGRSWSESFYGGALLAQIGELSFVLIASAYAASIISTGDYQLAIATISISLLLSPFWIRITELFTKDRHKTLITKV